MNQGSTVASELERLVALAERFAYEGHRGEAADLYRIALRLDPGYAAARRGLAAVEQQPAVTSPRTLREALGERMRRDSIDAAHFTGLARLYAERGDAARALECLEIASRKREVDPTQLALVGEVLLGRREYPAAASAFSRALRFDPFDRATAENLGRAEYERRHFREALAATVHAFLLASGAEEPEAERLRRRIRTLKRILGLDNSELSEVFHERQELLNVAFDRLAWHRERFYSETPAEAPRALAASASAPKEARGRLDVALRLRRQPLFRDLSDDQVFRLTRVVREEGYDIGEEVFACHDTGRDLYLVERGEVVLQTTTSYGTFALATSGDGELLGEDVFLNGGERSADAVVTQPAQLLRFDAGALDAQIETDYDLGVQVYWGLWHSLAQKLRETNRELRQFFGGSGEVEPPPARRRHPAHVAIGGGNLGEVKIDSSDKIRLFHEQGLTANELSTLAAFSSERRFPSGGLVFGEGDPGDEMFVVLEGRVLISQYIPGGGEEALAILERGDFFGEMALIEGAPRSADARAHEGELTLLALPGDIVREILHMDAQAAFELLALLTRLIARRLQEIDEKIVGWRILAGQTGQVRPVSA